MLECRIFVADRRRRRRFDATVDRQGANFAKIVFFVDVELLLDGWRGNADFSFRLLVVRMEIRILMERRRGRETVFGNRAIRFIGHSAKGRKKQRHKLGIIQSD